MSTDWYLAPALEVLRTEVDTRWPKRDRTTDGTIGDQAHQARTSDHNPNARGSVDAWDLDVDGVNVLEVLATFQRHPSAHYWIWQRLIADADDGWQPRPYDGVDPHTGHAHLSIRQTRTAEQDRRPWGLLEDTMKLPILVQEKGKSPVWIGDFIHRRWVRSPEELSGLRAQLRRAGLSADIAEWTPGTIGVLGVLVGPDPDGPTS